MAIQRPNRRDCRPSPGKSDHDLYREVIEDYAHDELGYDTAWFVEHAFSDYLPHPSPLITMSHIAAHAPDLVQQLQCSSAGITRYRCGSPWSAHDARSAADRQGRGTAKSEYDNYNVDMSTARARMNESYKIIELALQGEPFTYDGEFYQYDKPVRLRPGVAPGSNIQFYGTIGSPSGAENVATLGLPLLCQSQFPDKLLAKIHDTWEQQCAALGQQKDAPVIQVRTLIKDSDEKAFAVAMIYTKRVCCPARALRAR